MVDTDTEYEMYRGRHSGTKRSEVTQEGLETLKEYQDIIGVGRTIDAILAAVGYKRGALVTWPFPDDDEIDRFVETLNSMGVTCAVDRQNPEQGKTTTSIFVTRDESYTEEDFETISRLKGENMTEYHRELGEFLDYPETDMEHFIESIQTPPTEDEEQEDVEWTDSAFVSYVPAADSESVEEYDRRSVTRSRAIKAIERAYDVDLHDLAERYAADRGGSPQV